MKNESSSAGKCIALTLHHQVADDEEEDAEQTSDNRWESRERKGSKEQAEGSISVELALRTGKKARASITKTEAKPAGYHGNKRLNSNMAQVKQKITRKNVPIRRIENRSSRQVTFSKRRSGLLKKAWELSVLCDAQLALIIFSSSGRMFQFANPNLSKVVERYQNISKVSSTIMDTPKDVEYWKQEVATYKEALAHMDEKERHFMGEDIAALKGKELQKLESRIQAALNRIRTRKMQLWMQEARALRRKENLLLQENETIRCKLVEASFTRKSQNATIDRNAPSPALTVLPKFTETPGTINIEGTALKLGR